MSLLYWHLQIAHVLSVTGIGTFLMLTDRMLSKYHRNKQDRRAFRDSYLLAGVPMVIAYGVLDAYLVSDLLVHRIILHTDVEKPEGFLSGAISFQLLISNVIFVLIQKGVIENVVTKKGQNKTKHQ
jgi:formate-dependent nitrite reductase membrane component NrfD